MASARRAGSSRRSISRCRRSNCASASASAASARDCGSSTLHLSILTLERPPRVLLQCTENACPTTTTSQPAGRSKGDIRSGNARLLQDCSRRIIGAGCVCRDAFAMGTNAGQPGPAMGESLGSTPRVGIALLPVFNVPDRATIAYEALPRPERARPAAVARTALEAAHYSQPAVLLVPFTALLEAEDFSPAAMAAECGATPSEVAWIIAGPASRADPELVGRRV